MRIFLVNPSDVSFGTAVITPRWLYVLAAATPERFGTPTIVDETLEPFDANGVSAGDVVGIAEAYAVDIDVIADTRGEAALHDQKVVLGQQRADVEHRRDAVVGELVGRNWRGEDRLRAVGGLSAGYR